MVSCIDDLDFFKDFENEFSAIVYNDALTSKSDFLTKPTLCPQHINEFDFKDETSLSKYDEEEQNILYYNDLFPFNIIYPDDLKSDKGNDDNEIDMIQSSGEQYGYTNEDIADFEMSLARIYKREVHKVQGQSVFTSQVWRRLFDIRGPLVHELILEFFSTFRFGEIPDKRDLRDYWIGISSAGDFLSIALSYTSIRDLILRLCHRYLRLFALGRKQGAMIYGGKFVARLAKHFGLVTKEMLQGLTMIVRELSVINMAELVRLQIYEDIDDTCAWVASGLERQLDATAGAPRAAEDAPAADKGDQRMARLEEDMHEIRGALVEQREVIDVMARDFSIFTVWAAGGITQLLDSTGASYTSYSKTYIPYQRRVRRRTDAASTSVAQQDPQQRDL
ncbi:hypothetical protein Tco_0564268 [Tanacetum coccineum]